MRARREIVRAVDDGVLALEDSGIEGPAELHRSPRRACDFVAASSQMPRKGAAQKSADRGDEDSHGRSAARARPMRRALAMIVNVRFFAGRREKQAPSTM